MTDRIVFRNAEGVDLFDPAAVQRDACPVCGRRPNQRMRESDSLDAAWAEAETALPDGADLSLFLDHRDGYTAEASRTNANRGGRWTGGFSYEANGPTPAAALRALAAKLREPAERT